MEESTGLTPADWHSRYQLQAVWTSEIRHYLFSRASIEDARRILEVGCGSGVICSTLYEYSHVNVTGLDIDLPILRKAVALDISNQYVNGDALSLPFSDRVFDAVVCHYFLLWVHSPLVALKEMARVCRSGGTVMALAEPDYDSRIDYPAELERLGSLQAEGLKHQGADIQAGRKLASWFHQAGAEDIECGILGAQWLPQTPSRSFLESEWQMLEHDLSGTLTGADLARYRAIDRQAWTDGIRVLHVPTFYAIGRVG